MLLITHQFENKSLPEVLELIGQQAFERYLHFQIQILKKSNSNPKKPKGHSFFSHDSAWLARQNKNQSV